MLSFLRQTSPVRLAIFLLFALTCYRLWFITQMEMVPDETYSSGTISICVMNHRR